MPINLAATRLMDTLEQKRVVVGMGRVKFAKVLNVTHACIASIEAGKRDPGTKLLRQIVREYPDLQPEVLAYLRDS